MIRKFIKFYKPHLRVFIPVLTVSIIAALIDSVIPTLTSQIINEGIAKNNIELFKNIAIFMAILYFLKVVTTYVVTLYGHMVGVSIEYRMRSNLYKKILSMPIKFFDNNAVGSLMSRITTDLTEIAEVAHHGPEDILMSIILLITSLFFMFNKNVLLASVILILVPIIIIINIFSRKKFFDTNLDLKIKVGDINSQVGDTFNGIRQVKAFANEEYEVNKFKINNDSFFISKKSFYKVMAVYMSSIRGYLGILNFITIVLGAYLVIEGEMNTGDLTAFIMYVNLFQRPIDLFSSFIMQYNNAASGFYRYLSIMDLETQDLNESGQNLSNVSGHIEFKNVYFKYEEDSNYVLENFNLIIPAGKTVAIVGESGAGKTTICNLLNKYYEIEKGEILIDGININDLKLTDLRKNIGLVTQDVFIFSGSVNDNISYGDLTRSREEISTASKQALLDDVVIQLNEGYDSYLGEHGVKLSGGQKQRLALARVFLKNPPIMVLDEATSALDNNTEREIQGVIETLSAGRTNIIVAHRLSTIVNADKIIVLSGNGVEEQGNHEELMALKKSYYALYNASLKID